MLPYIDSFSHVDSDASSSGLPVPAIRSQLGRLLNSRYFRTSPRLKQFLQFTVEQSIAGSAVRLKEYSIALEVFKKPDSFDPRTDSAVRVAARQLRSKLDVYYLSEGSQDEVLIRFRAGDYVPRFYQRSFESADGISFHPPRSSEFSALLVEKDRASLHTVMEALDSLHIPVCAVLDSAEDALAYAPTGKNFLVTGLALAGGLSGIDLIRNMHSASGMPSILVVPLELSSETLDDVIESKPEAVVFKPLRSADVALAVQMATRRDGFTVLH